MKTFIVTEGKTYSRWMEVEAETAEEAEELAKKADSDKWSDNTDEAPFLDYTVEEQES